MTRKSGWRASTLIALTTAAAVALTGCGAGFEDDDATASERISVAMMQPPTAGLSPFSDDVAKISRLSIGETLVRLDQDGQLEPLLATEWERTSDLEWVFTLREGVTFHDGTEFNAEAAQNSFDEAINATTPPRALSGITISVEVTGENEITITTDESDPLLTNRLASPQMSMFAESAYLEDGRVTPVGTGTGPFELVDLSGTSTATLDRFDDYWGDTALIAGIDVTFVPDGAARAGAIRAGEADVAESIPVSQVSLLDSDQAHEVSMPRSTFVTFNSMSGPFEDEGVRAAARAAIDPERIVEAVYEGQADAATGLLGPAVPWAEEHRGDTDSTTSPADIDGIDITVATYTDRAELPEIAVQVQSQLESAGFNVTLDVREYVNMEGEMLEDGFDAVIMSRNIMLDTGDPMSFLLQDFTCNGGFNYAHLCNEDIDSLVQRSLQIDAGTERQQATMDIEAAIMQLDVVAPLVYERVVQAESGTFSDIVRDPLERRLITEYTQPS